MYPTTAQPVFTIKPGMNTCKLVKDFRPKFLTHPRVSVKLVTPVLQAHADALPNRFVFPVNFLSRDLCCVFCF